MFSIYADEFNPVNVAVPFATGKLPSVTSFTFFHEEIGETVTFVVPSSSE